MLEKKHYNKREEEEAGLYNHMVQQNTVLPHLLEIQK